ncbi:MAG: ATP-dependent Clp protease proteolytic subunit [Deltaproteobacteria bacterium]|nr:ATP-dependent Clp protease proteolytic subunit [Deltaproteobacteria bacterium]
MNPVDLFWFFLIVIALQPIIKQKSLEFARRRLIAKLEQQRSSRVILLVHRQETMGFLGFPILRFIDVNDSEEVIRAIHLTDPEMPLDIILHTPGGLVLASLQIARALSRHPGKVTVFVPHYAMSGGTLIALAADEIVMCEHAVLGPVDPQIGQLPAASVLRAVAKKPLEALEDKTLILADQAEMAIVEVRNSIRELVSPKFPPEKAEEVAAFLAEGNWTHDFPITFDVAKSLGLPVSSDMPKEVLALMSYFPQPVRTTPAVEYLPIPRRAKPS